MYRNVSEADLPHYSRFSFGAASASGHFYFQLTEC